MDYAEATKFVNKLPQKLKTYAGFGHLARLAME